MTARALVLAAMSVDPSTLRHPLRARDTVLMGRGLRGMGTHVSSVDEQLWVVRPRPLRGPAHVDVECSGTAMRFLPPVAGLADGPVSFGGDPSVRGKALRPLVGALRYLGVRVETATGRLPLTVQGIGRVPGGEVCMDASASSQLVSGLLLAGSDFDHGVAVRHQGPPLAVAPHIRMTVHMLRAAGAAVDDTEPNRWGVEPGRLRGRGWNIEPDLTSAGPFLAAALVTGGRVTVPNWPQHTIQPGEQLLALLDALGAHCAPGTTGLTVRGTGTIRGISADLSMLGPLLPVIAALCALADSDSTLYGLGGWRHDPAGRLPALVQGLCTLGAEVTLDADRLTIRPRPLKGDVFDTRADHRLAHAAAVLGLAVSGVVLSDVACTAKTLPDFPAMWNEMIGSCC